VADPLATLEILARDYLSTAEAGHDLVRLLRETFPRAAPKRWGHDKPARQFRDDVLGSEWASPFVWTAEHSSLEGYASAALAPHDRSVLLVEFAAEPADEVAAIAFLRAAAARFQAEFAFLHMYTDEDRRAGAEALAAVGQVAFRDLRRTAIPYLYWATVFGPSYVDFFSRDKLVAAPAYEVEELAPGVVLVQLTQRLRDCVSDWDRVHERRVAVAEHLGRDAFYNAAQPHAEYPRPEFPLMS